MTKRPSLSSFAPAITGAKVEHSESIQAQTIPASSSPSGDKYPKISVYLTKEEIRTIKLIAIDNGQKVSDILSTAVREWLARNGHARIRNNS